MNDFMGRFNADPMDLSPEQVTPEMQQYLSQRIGPQMPRGSAEY
jgi:hypothetical protein